MTRDELERALRSTVDPHERAYRATSLPASVEEARRVQRSSRSPRAPWGVVRAVAAVAVVIVAAVGITAGYRLVTRDAGSGTGEGLVPTVAPTSTSVPSGAPRACRAADFAITSDPWDAGAGSRGTRVVFRAADSLGACVLGGQLTARIVDGGGEELVAADSDATPSVTVTGGAQLEIGVAWSNWCGAAPTEPLELRVRFPSDSQEAALVPPAGTSILVPPCMGAGQATSLSVTRFEASTRPSPEG